MAMNKDRNTPDEPQISPGKRKEVMPSYSYYFSDCSSIISSVKCALSADDEASRNASPNFGTLSSSTNDINFKSEYYAENTGSVVGDASVYRSASFKNEASGSNLVNQSNCIFDQEDELASASMENDPTVMINSSEKILETLSGYADSEAGESMKKFSRWCKRYSSGNIEMFRSTQQNRMKDILEENNLKIGDLKSKYFDEFPIKVLYSKGTTLTDKKFEVASLKPDDVIVDRYHVVEIIGNTAFSKVVKARDLTTETDVCMKIVLSEYFDQALDEVVLLKLLNSKDDQGSKSIVRLYDTFLYSGSVFLVLELLGPNLFETTKDYYVTRFRDILNPVRPKRWTLEDLKKISHDILEALNFIHNFGIINCDLKPENVLLVDSKGTGGAEGGKMVKIIDFGSSCFIRDKLNTYVQSRSYRAPEVVLGLPYDTQIDMWSFGCILCEMYMGRILFPSDNSATLVASMVSLLGVPPVYMLQHKMNSMFIILPNGSIADLNVPTHILKNSPYYNKLDHSSLCCNLSASDSSKCSHVTYNKWDNATVNVEPTLDDNSSGLDDSSDYYRNFNDRDWGKRNSSSILDNHIKIANYEDNIRCQENYQNALDCKIKLDIRHNRNGLTKFMRIIQPFSSSIDVMLESDSSPDLRLFADFVKGLLQYDPLDRLTAAAALKHPFILSRN